MHVSLCVWCLWARGRMIPCRLLVGIPKGSIGRFGVPGLLNDVMHDKEELLLLSFSWVPMYFLSRVGRKGMGHRETKKVLARRIHGARRATGTGRQCSWILYDTSRIEKRQHPLYDRGSSGAGMGEEEQQRHRTPSRECSIVQHRA